MVLALGCNGWLSPGGRANKRMQVTPSAADFYERCLAWASDSILFGVSRAPNAERYVSVLFPPSVVLAVSIPFHYFSDLLHTAQTLLIKKLHII